MMKINNRTAHTVNFGLTLRETDINLGGECKVKNCNYLIRESESPPLDVAGFLAKSAKEAEKTEVKIWGSSDLSNFCSRTIALQKTMGREEYKKHFNDIDLMDIDKEIAGRSKKHIIGLTSAELEDVSYVYDESPFKYFQKLNDGKNYLLPGEEANVVSLSQVEQELLLSDRLTGYERKQIAKPKQVEFYRISPDIMYGTRINADERMIDIREGINLVTEPKKGVRRIFEFANGWYFLPREHQMKLVNDISKKLQKDDVMIVGRCELVRGIGEEFVRKGFEAARGLKELFIKRI